MAGAFISHLLLTGMVTTQVGADETYSLEAIYVTIVTLSTFSGWIDVFLSFCGLCWGKYVYKVVIMVYS